ncbi:MAG: NADH-quinone oxidoreductase subunit NuoF [Pseudomonadota bacterium]
MQKILTKNFSNPDSHKLETAKANGAYSSLEKLKKLSPAQVIEEIIASELRGRGGAGFLTGQKWSFVPQNSGLPTYLIVNADEGEPGTFKDRAILEKDPHLLIEGIIIAAHAIQAKTVYVYFRGEYYQQWQIFLTALEEARQDGLLLDLIIITHRGAGAYICGEETALLNSLEGKRGLPRSKPPYPASQGLFNAPTVVNNVETLANLPFIINQGAKAFTKIGTKESKGTKLISVCGHINCPGVYEIEMGLPLATFLAEYAGGTIEERPIKAVFPGGISSPILTAQETLRTNISYESLRAAGSMLGSGGMIVIDESYLMSEILHDVAKFFQHESCGQCTPCREGTGWVYKIAQKIRQGYASNKDLDLLLELADNMQGKTICVFADALAMPLRSLVTKFRDELKIHIK